VAQLLGRTCHFQIRGRGGDGGSQAGGREVPLGLWCGSDTAVLCQSSPERLVGDERAHHLRASGSEGGAGCACAPVVHHGSHPWEQLLVVNILHSKNVIT
jgi:hypothetical protein